MSSIEGFQNLEILKLIEHYHQVFPYILQTFSTAVEGIDISNLNTNFENNLIL